MKKIFGNYFFNFFFILLVGAAIVFFAISGNSEGVFEALSAIKPGYVLLSVGLIFLWQFSIGIILKVLVHKNHPEYRLSQGFVNSLVASFFHGITPSASGGQFAQFYVFSKQGVDAPTATSSLWLEFLIYQSTMCVMGLILIILKFPMFYNEYSNLFIFVLLGFALNTSIILGIFALGRFKKVHQWISTKGIDLAYRFHFIKDKEQVLASINEQLEKFAYEASHLKEHKKAIIICIFLNIIRLICYYSVPFVIFVALGAPLTFDSFLNSLAMGSFVAIVSGLIPIPGASGGTEAIFVMMFSNLFAMANVTGAMLIWRFLTYYLLIMVGGISFLYIKMKKGEAS